MVLYLISPLSLRYIFSNGISLDFSLQGKRSALELLLTYLEIQIFSFTSLSYYFNFIINLMVES